MKARCSCGDAANYRQRIVGNIASHRGGAVANRIGNQLIDNSLFDGNKVVSDGYAYGGAVDNDAGSSYTQIINNSIFVNNTASSTYSYTVEGGAVRNNRGAQLIIDSQFINNGAICSSGGAFGGAIFIVGSATTTLVAQDKDILFEGNYVSSKGSATKTPDAIYMYDNSNAALNLNASAGRSIIFNDRISSYSSVAAIHINNTGTWDNSTDIFKDLSGSNSVPVSAGTTGTIVLNEDMSGYRGNVYIYGGTVKVGWDRTNTYGQAVTPKFFNSSYTNIAAAATVDLVNGKATDSITKVVGNGSLLIDVDPAAGITDNFSLYRVAQDCLILKGINFLSDVDGESASLTVGSGAGSFVPFKLDYTNIYTNGNSYALSTTNGKILTITRTSTFDSFQDAFKSDGANKYFNFSRNEYFGESSEEIYCGNLGGKSLVVDGNGFMLAKNAYNNNYLGMVVDDGQELSLNYLGKFTKTETSSSSGMLFPDGKYYTVQTNNMYGIASSRAVGEYLDYSVLKNAGTTSITNSYLSKMPYKTHILLKPAA